MTDRGQFLVWIDHKNLEYLRTAKRLNARQAQGGLYSLIDSTSLSLIILAPKMLSLMVLFIPLPKLPSAKETAKVVLHHVFRFHGFPRDVLFDQGPQFVAPFL